jgi:hypothetical protein
VHTVDIVGLEWPAAKDAMNGELKERPLSVMIGWQGHIEWLRTVRVS